VVQELRGEKIDIISWHPDPHKFVCNALAPAEISRVIVDEANQAMEVIVPDEFLSIAIGKKGQNVRLASKLSGWHLDVKSETRYSKAMKSGYDSLVALPGVGISMADALYEEGFYSAEEVSKASVDHLIQIRGIGEEKATKLIEGALEFIETQQAEDEAEDENADETAVEPDGTEDTEQAQSDADEIAADPEDQNSESDDAKGQAAQAEEISPEAEDANASTPEVDSSTDEVDAPTEEVADSETSDESEVDKTG
jgi:N utilization substance protein A